MLSDKPFVDLKLSDGHILFCNKTDYAIVVTRLYNTDSNDSKIFNGRCVKSSVKSLCDMTVIIEKRNNEYDLKYLVSPNGRIAVSVMTTEWNK